MIIHHAEYVASAVYAPQYPSPDYPEIALAGRSNVGKSSLINRVINRRNLARTGNTPGKTQTLNFYLINQGWYFVDLPGYGYAKVSKDTRASWGKMMGNYLEKRESLRAVLQVVDMRHEPSKEDLEMHNWLRHFQIPTLVVATKADKISRGQWPKQLAMIAKTLDLPDWHLILPFSAQTGQGVDELHKELEEILQSPVSANNSEQC